MSKWRSYGQRRHSFFWWQNMLNHYIEIRHFNKLKYNPKIISVSKHNIVFGLKSFYGHFILSKKKIIETISPQLN